MKRKYAPTGEERIHLIKSIHRLCELRRAKASRALALKVNTRQRKCKICKETFFIEVPRENRRMYCDECIVERRREVSRKSSKKYQDKIRQMKQEAE